ncbi:hypothetical protein [Chryseobacterium binzhouense]|uniref:hypothetical protein n=1 Tax=Chryseobacterium binzhouense TaxID=2593646 RepID=UPI001180EBB9|nr:hypothetical protein [Chryseobacterium binzhouense]
MKYFKIISIFILTILFSACSEDDNHLSTDLADTGIYLKTISNNSTQFTPDTFSTSRIDLILELGGNSAEQRLSVVNMYITYKDSENVFTGGEKLARSYSIGNFVKDSSSGLLRKKFQLSMFDIFAALDITDNTIYDQADIITVRFEAVAKDGKKFTNTNLGQEMTTAYYNSPFIYTFSVFCPFNSADFNGNFEVIEDTWQDYANGDLVPVTLSTTPNQLIVKATNNPYLVNNTSAEMTVTFDPATGTITSVVSNEDFDYGGGSIFAVTGSGKIDFCTKTITINPLNFGSLTGYKFVLKGN